MKLLFYTLLFFSFTQLIAQTDLSGTVTFPDSVGIDLIKIEVWQNNQQIASTITDPIGYFEIDSIITGVNNIYNPVPSSFELYPNYPSPFDKKTNIIYEVNEPEEISITIYNSIGQKITTLTSGYRQKGFYVAQWNGRNSFGNEVAQGIYFARLDNGKDAKHIKLLKINGALNAIGTSIPGSFYSSYKGSNINEDYLIKFIDINIVNRIDYAEITLSLPAQIHQVLTEAFSYSGPSQIVGVEGEQIAIAKSWFNYGTQLDTIELMNTNVWELVNATLDSLYFATIDTTLNGQIPLELKTIALHSTVDTTELNTVIAAETYSVFGFVTTPNGMPLDSVDVAAYDTLGNFLNRDITVQDGSFAIDSITAVTIDLIFNDLKNRTNTETLRVTIPAEVNKILRETYAGYQGQNPQGEEGREIGVAKADFPYNTGLDSLILVNNNIWHFVRSTVDSIFYATNDTTVNGQIPLILKAIAVGGTQNQENLTTNLQDMVYISGKIVDNDLYFQGDGPPHPGILDYLGERMVFSNGTYTIRVLAQDSIDILTTPTNAQGDTTGWTSTQTIPANTDQTGIILHPVTNNTIEGLEALFSEFYSLVNDSPRHFNYFGKKYIKKTNPAENVYWIPRVTVYGDTITTADQDSVENYLLNNLIPGQQQPMGIYKATFQDTTDLFNDQGRIYIFISPFGNASGGTADYDNDGQIDQGTVTLPKLGGQFYWPWAAQEIFTTEVGPNELNDPRFTPYTVLESGGSNFSELQIFDKKLRRIGENFPPKEDKSRILGGAKFN